MCLVWINMLPLDNRWTAALAATSMSSPLVRNFHDPERLVGRSMAGSLGAADRIAWDTYLFYPPEAEWGERPPPPSFWAHQLGDAWADPARYRTGQELERELQAGLRLMLPRNGTSIASHLP